jgi:hypothetical protein
MPSFVQPAIGLSADISVPANARIAVFSQGAFKVFQKTTYTNAPAQLVLLTNGDVAAGSAQFTSSVFTAATTIVVEAFGGLVVYYEVGTDAVVKQVRLLNPIQTDPVALNADGAITAAAIMGGIVTSTTAAAVAGTVPTGAVMDLSGSWAVNESVDWSIINTGPNSFTVTAAASGHTIVGGNGAAFVVPTLTACLARTRKTAADTFITYSISRPVS